MYKLSIISILLFLLSISGFAQDRKNSAWVNTNFGEIRHGGFGFNVSVDYETKAAKNTGSYSIGFVTGAQWHKGDIEYDNLLVGIKAAYYYPVFNWLDIYAGTLQGVDVKVYGIEYDYWDDYESARLDTEWNRWWATAMGGVRIKIGSYFSIFGEISGGSSALKYSAGFGINFINF